MRASVWARARREKGDKGAEALCARGASCAASAIGRISGPVARAADGERGKKATETGAKGGGGRTGRGGGQGGGDRCGEWQPTRQRRGWRPRALAHPPLPPPRAPRVLRGIERLTRASARVDRVAAFALRASRSAVVMSDLEEAAGLVLERLADLGYAARRGTRGEERGGSRRDGGGGVRIGSVGRGALRGRVCRVFVAPLHPVGFHRFVSRSVGRMQRPRGARDQRRAARPAGTATAAGRARRARRGDGGRAGKGGGGGKGKGEAGDEGRRGPSGRGVVRGPLAVSPSRVLEPLSLFLSLSFFPLPARPPASRALLARPVAGRHSGPARLPAPAPGQRTHATWHRAARAG